MERRWRAFNEHLACMGGVFPALILMKRMKGMLMITGAWGFLDAQRRSDSNLRRLYAGGKRIYIPIMPINTEDIMRKPKKYNTSSLAIL